MKVGYAGPTSAMVCVEQADRGRQRGGWVFYRPLSDCQRRARDRLRRCGRTSTQVAVRVGNAWVIDTPILPIDAGGHNPRAVLIGDEVHIFHASTTGVLDVDSDDTLIRTIRRANGVYDSVVFPDFAVGTHRGGCWRPGRLCCDPSPEPKRTLR